MVGMRTMIQNVFGFFMIVGLSVNKKNIQGAAVAPFLFRKRIYV